MNRSEIASLIIKKIESQREILSREFLTPGRIQNFVVEDLLDPKLVRQIYEAFPKRVFS